MLIGMLHFTILVGSLVLASVDDSESAERRIAILDGETTKYDSNAPNWEILKNSVLPSIFPGDTLTIEPFNVSTPTANGKWVNAATIAAFKPDIILAHWSAFKPLRGQYCDITTNQEGRECALRLLETLNDARGEDGRRAKVVIYSRKPDLCFRGTQNGFESAIGRSTDQRPDVGLSLLLGRTGFMTMTPSPDRRNFEAAGVQPALLRLIWHLECPSRRPLLSGDRNGGLCVLGRIQEEAACE